jgi:hypothetical protein
MVFEVYSKRRNLGESKDDFAWTTFNYDSFSKKLVAFSVVQIYINKEIIKYDTAHKGVHVHKYYLKNPLIQDLSYLEINPLSYRNCLNDILINWQKYKELYLKKEMFNNM